MLTFAMDGPFAGANQHHQFGTDDAVGGRPLHHSGARPHIGCCRSRASPRSDAASPESITTDRGYGFRAPSLRSGPGMTDTSVDSTPTKPGVGHSVLAALCAASTAPHPRSTRLF